MIYSLRGTLAAVRGQFAVIETGGIGFKVFLAPSTFGKLPRKGEEVQLFCFLYVRENALDLYGFSGEDELHLFELLNSVSGIGPKLALGVLSVAETKHIKAAISEGRTELLTKASGIGKRTAERVILELRGKIEPGGAKETVKKMEADQELEEALVGLGYVKSQVRQVIGKIPESQKGLEARLRYALKVLKQK